jgi:hypothetical protein
MQHYGLPTRLLDWSESALVGLYFAVQETSSDHNGCVWILNPRVVNLLLSKIGNFIPIYSDKSVEPYLPALWDERPDIIPAMPVSIDPPYNSPRLAAQRGKFAVYGSTVRALDEYSEIKDQLLRIDIKPNVKARIRRQLLTAGMVESVLFPGLAGLSREIRDLYAIPYET